MNDERYEFYSIGPKSPLKLRSFPTLDEAIDAAGQSDHFRWFIVRRTETLTTITREVVATS